MVNSTRRNENEWRTNGRASIIEMHKTRLAANMEFVRQLIHHRPTNQLTEESFSFVRPPTPSTLHKGVAVDEDVPSNCFCLFSPFQYFKQSTGYTQRDAPARSTKLTEILQEKKGM